MPRFIGVWGFCRVNPGFSTASLALGFSRGCYVCHSPLSFLHFSCQSWVAIVPFLPPLPEVLALKQPSSWHLKEVLEGSKRDAYVPSALSMLCDLLGTLGKYLTALSLHNKILFNNNHEVVIIIMMKGDPWVAQRFGACLWPRAQSRSPGIESHVRLPTWSLLLPLPVSLPLSPLSMTIMNK